ncbi:MULTISPECIES: SpoIIE family protein phosphatase [Sorangium]|uniref:Phosphoserine phosphatase n=1 Tax=Sorangium cellulosum TaxID=56 RepID=A0A4V0NFX2_SORCE|nr:MULTISPECIES: SpoIIE family protein phosphatase [Sorangium]AUX31162.1 phosphoserine phosphatase [Sorangium cellulosum]WCQ90544.1 DNA binding protein [Sorangium sp. Soce836]
MTRKRRTIAFLVDNVVGDYQSELRAGVERAAEAHDVNLLTAFGDPSSALRPDETDRSTFYHLIGPDTADGVIVASSTLSGYGGVDVMRAFCRSFAPLPVCSIGMAIDGVPSLMVDNALGSEISVAHLADEHGRRRIAYIGGPSSSEEAQLRAGGYRRALAARALPCDERLVAVGAFTIPTGREAMREIVARGAEFDAVVAANDKMALAAIEVLKAEGLRIPEDVLVCGFDDVGIARFTKPSLTTVHQPIKRLGGMAVSTILRLIGGEAVPALELAKVELTQRESCGCGYRAGDAILPPSPPVQGYPRPVSDQRAPLESALRRSVAIPIGALDGWAGDLLTALEEELAGDRGRFLRALQALLDEARREGVLLDQFQAVISLLRERVRPAPAGGDAAALEPLWHAARLLIGSESVHVEGEQRLRVELAAIDVIYGARGFAACLSLPVLKGLLASELPRMQLSHVAVSLYDDAQRASLRPLFLMDHGREVEAPPLSFPARRLAPPGFLGGAERSSMVVLPVAFGDVETFGVAVLDSRASAMSYDVLRVQLGSAVKAAALHREVVREVELRERLEQERVRQESHVAARIQTALVPKQLSIEGLELCAAMQPAAEVGGDYYDVLATPGGGWLGIGDVAGHGLAAGLIMLMIQSMVSALTSNDPSASPARVVVALNKAVYKNVRGRLDRDEHATLLLLRYERSGRVTFAGAHDDMIVCSARTRRCTCIASSGVWIGALPEIGAMTRDAELFLEDGDVLVLYSDGVTEARNAQHEQFGLERLCAIIEAVQTAPVEVIRDRILEAVEGWCPSPDDDITIVVARYRAPE